MAAVRRFSILNKKTPLHQHGNEAVTTIVQIENYFKKFQLQLSAPLTLHCKFDENLERKGHVTSPVIIQDYK